MVDNGYPEIVEYSVDQDGFKSFFKINRANGDGVAIFINGIQSWVGDDGIERSADFLTQGD